MKTNLKIPSQPLSNAIQMLFKLLMRLYKGRGGGGGSSSRIHEQKKQQQITDHGYQNFISLNHENKQVRYLLEKPALTVERVFKESKVMKGLK